MRGQIISNSTAGASLVAKQAVFELDTNSRRSAHSSSAWTLPGARNAMQQPQDGAQTGVVGAARALLSSIRHSSVFAEPEDAKITGGTRSLSRRLLGLNVTSVPRKAPLSAWTALTKRQTA